MASQGIFPKKWGSSSLKKSRQVFPVSEVVKTAEEQTYLKLADGRGWVPWHPETSEKPKITGKNPVEICRNGAFRSDKRGIFQAKKIKVYQI